MSPLERIAIVKRHLFLFAALALALSSTVAHADQSETKQDIEQGTKDAARKTGHAAQGVGHATANGARKVGHATANGARTVGTCHQVWRQACLQQGMLTQASEPALLALTRTLSTI